MSIEDIRPPVRGRGGLLSGNRDAQPSEAEAERSEKLSGILASLGAGSSVKCWRVATRAAVEAGEDEGPVGRRSYAGTIALTDEVLDNFDESMSQQLGGGSFVLEFRDVTERKFSRSAPFHVDTHYYPTIDRTKERRERESTLAEEKRAREPKVDVAALIAQNNAQMMQAQREMMERFAAQQREAMQKTQNAEASTFAFVKLLMEQQQAQIVQAERSAERMVAMMQAQAGQVPKALSPLEQMKSVAEMMSTLDAIRPATQETARSFPEQLALNAAAPVAERLMAALMPAQQQQQATPQLPQAQTQTPPPRHVDVVTAKEARIPYEAKLMTRAEVEAMRKAAPPPGSASVPASVVPAAPRVGDFAPSQQQKTA